MNATRAPVSRGAPRRQCPGHERVRIVKSALKRTVEDRFGHVRVRGEISGFKRAASGHIYFSLKDENARLDAVMWKGGAARLPFAPEDGLEVVATGQADHLCRALQLPDRRRSA